MVRTRAGGTLVVAVTLVAFAVFSSDANLCALRCAFMGGAPGGHRVAMPSPSAEARSTGHAKAPQHSGPSHALCHCIALAQADAVEPQAIPAPGPAAYPAPEGSFVSHVLGPPKPRPKYPA